MTHGRIGYSLKHVTGQSDTAQNLRERIMMRRRALQLDLQVHAVDLFPHFRGDRVSNRARILTGGSQTRVNGIRVFLVEGEKTYDLVFSHGLAVSLLENLHVAGSIDQWLPLMSGRQRKIELQVEIDSDKARDVFSALGVTRHPMHGICDAAKQRTFFARHDAATSGLRLSTQVSLLPPPCDEFTTSEPFLSATRVRPPAIT